MKIYILAFVIIAVSARITNQKGHRKIIHKRPQHRQTVEVLEVRTQNGIVVGGKSSTVDEQRPYYYFKGIPFAAPPIGNRRFLPPQQVNRWTGTWNATYERSICVQQDPSLLRIIGSEDCLYVNIYTPQLPTNQTSSLLPVMVWVHGGAFFTGDGNYDTAGPDFFLDENVLIVTFNYRLGILGFLSTGDEAAPGNNGLRDQIALLRWVQRNIAAFGGDPRNVTIFGESAGSGSVSYLLQTNLTAGLYKGAIMQSGTALCLWTLSRLARENAFNVGRRLGIQTENSRVLVESLRNISVDQLQGASVLAMLDYLVVDPFNGFIYAPVKEPSHRGAVFSSRTYGLLESGQFNRVPLLLGFNSLELVGFAPLVSLLRAYIIPYDLIPSRLVPVDMNIKDNKIIQDVGNAIKLHYVGAGGSFTFSNSFYNYTSADQLERPIRQYVKLVSNKVPTYFYILSYEGKLGKPNRGGDQGVGHGEDLNYLFLTSNDSVSFEDNRTRKRLVRLWTNFAKTGNPTPTGDPLLQNVAWTPSNPDNLTYLDIGVKLRTKINPKASDMAFWDYIYQQYGNPPYDTY